MDLADDISYSVQDVEDAVFGGHLQLESLTKTAARSKVFEKTRQWYLPKAGEQELDKALRRLEELEGWVPYMSGTRASMAALKALTSQLIGRFAASAMQATRQKYGSDRPLTRYCAQLIVPQETQEEIAVMKGIATAYVMTVRDAQPHYDNQREILGILVEALLENPNYLDSIFAADFQKISSTDHTARLRLVIDQVASLTDRSAVSLYQRITGNNWGLGDKPLW